MMTVNIVLTKEEKEIAEKYAAEQNLSLEDSMKNVFFEKIEEEYDIALADATLKEYEKDPTTFSHEEVKNILTPDKASN